MDCPRKSSIKIIVHHHCCSLSLIIMCRPGLCDPHWGSPTTGWLVLGPLRVHGCGALDHFDLLHAAHQHVLQLRYLHVTSGVLLVIRGRTSRVIFISESIVGSTDAKVSHSRSQRIDITCRGGTLRHSRGACWQICLNNNNMIKLSFMCLHRELETYALRRPL